MIDIFTYKIVYFILALILGFLIGYIIKKNSYEDKVELEVEKLEKDFDNSSSELRDVNKNLIESENRHKINKDLILTQKDVISKIKDDIVQTKQKILNLEEAKVGLKENFNNSKVKLETYKDKISELKPEYENAEDDTKKYESLQKLEKEQSEKLITSTATLKDIENTVLIEDNKIQECKDSISIQEENINTLKNSYKRLEDKKPSNKPINKSELEKSAEDLRIKVLNYKYEIIKQKDKISKGITDNSKNIDEFVSKNEQKRFIDKFISNIFSIKNKKAK